MRLAFMGTPDFSVPALQALHDAGHEVIAVYTQPPRPAGRGKAPRPSPVQKRAETLGLPVATPENFRADEDVAAFHALDIDAAIVVAYGLILPETILAAPRRGCLNLHASMLPRWRGAAPIQRAIMAGDTETGVCVMQMERGLDTGPVLLRRALPIREAETAATLHDRLSELGSDLIVDALARIDDLTAEPQSDEGVTYARKIDKAEARIDWSRPSDELDRTIRGLSPFPGAWCEIRGERTKILLGAPEAGEGPPGAVLDGGLLIACGEDGGAIRLIRLQRAGKAPAEAEAFLRGFPISKGELLT